MENQGKRNTIPKRKTKQDIQFSILNNMEHYFEKKLHQTFPQNFYNEYRLIGPQDEDRKNFSRIFEEMENTKNFDPQKLKLSEVQSRGIGSMLGMAICDALGSCTEFIDFKKQGYDFIKNGFEDIETLIKSKKIRSRHGENNVWTDDASMGICMAISLLLKDYELDQVHIRYMFILWLWHGLGNGGRKHSIGLGGNIKISMDEFFDEQTKQAKTGNQFNNGNGSLMRLAPIPIAFWEDQQKAMQHSALQSLTTHNGLEAKECCRLLAAIIVKLMKRKEDENENQNENQYESQNEEESQMQDESNTQSLAQKKQQSWKKTMDEICSQFKSQISSSVQFLAWSQQQSQETYNKNIQTHKPFKYFNPTISDRNWNWKDKQFTYSRHRTYQQPGYIGSYCMDALSMALHTVWHTQSFKECALMNANMGGDCDTVGSIAGQISGAIHGIDRDMLKLYSEMKDFKQKRFEVFLLAYKLVNRKSFRENNEASKMEMEK